MLCEYGTVAATDQHTPDHSHNENSGNEHTGAEHTGELQTREGHAAGLHGRDPYAEPSEDWGWHGTLPKATNIAGWFTVIALFAMLIGNHTSHVEWVYLIGLGTLIAVMLIGGYVAKFRARRR